MILLTLILLTCIHTNINAHDSREGFSTTETHYEVQKEIAPAG